MNIKDQLSSLPEQPGVYQFFNSQDEIIYVGKAKNLKKRVSSYFSKVHESSKTNVLVKNISSLKYIVVDSESDALLLENNLIKEYQPRYNMLLKDDKTYPSICITNEPFPRIFKTRSILKNGSRYFGPYSSNSTLNSLLDIIHQLYPIRTCKLPLTPQSIQSGKYKVCLQYHIHKCNGPCENLQSIEEYRFMIDQVLQLLRGDANEISKFLFSKMQTFASQCKFEEAHEVKLKYQLFENFKSRSIISNTVLEDTDVFGYDEDNGSVFVNILRVSKGCIVQGFTIEYKKRTEEEAKEMLASAVFELRSRFNSNSKEIILPFDIDYLIPHVTAIVPQRGDRKKLLDLSMQNVQQYKLDKLKQNEKLNPDQRAIHLLEQIKDKLHLPKLPLHIEIFDNSNIQGSSPVAACVVYRKAKPFKKEYRKYHIKTVSGPDDYASLREIIYRRYTRLIEENIPFPDLIVADGGVGQMEIIRSVLYDDLKIQIPIVGLAKDRKHKTNEILVGFPPSAVGLKATDPIFKFFSAMQEEVHRFAISFHRSERSKKQVVSELDSIPGIGEKIKSLLIQEYKSIKRIKMLSKSELAKTIGSHRASIVYLYFHPIESS